MAAQTAVSGADGQENGDFSAFVKMIQAKFKSFLEKIITMDEFVVSMHTQETKMQLKRCLKKGTPDPTKAKVATSRTKQMALAFFNDRGFIKTNYIPPGPTVNGDYMFAITVEGGPRK
jgi:hypothetical protein